MMTSFSCTHARFIQTGAVFLLFFLLFAESVWAGGGWVPKPGKGYVQAGYSRKTADYVWDAEGNKNFTNNFHDFRYGYFSGEIGLFKRVSGTWTMTYLWGYEGAKDDMEENFGLSDAWFGGMFQLSEGTWPMAIRATVRTPFFYDQRGPYVRHLYNVEPYRLPDGTLVVDSTFHVINNPEWRGLLKTDYTIAFNISRSILNYQGWATFEAGYNFRTGVPSDDVPVNLEVGYTLPVAFSPMVKVNLNGVFSVHNNDPVGDVNDRFRATSSFNDASIIRGSVTVILPLGNRFFAQAGYGEWLWGIGARDYTEPFASVYYNIGQ